MLHMGAVGRRRTVRSLAATVVVVVALAACGGPTPSGEPPRSGEPPPSAVDPGPPISDSVSRDSVLVQLSLDRGRLETGGVLWARVEVRNVGPGPIVWQGGGCGLRSDFRLDGPALVQPHPGRDWSGLAGIVKRAAFPQGISLTGFVDPSALNAPFQMICTADLRIEEIGPGEAAVVDVVWSAVTSDGAPTPPGAYHLGFDFPFLGRMARDDFRGDAHADQRPITVELPVEVVGEPFAGIPAPAAIDAALSHARVAGWLRDRVTRERLNGSSIRFERGAWVFEVDVIGGVTRVRIDAVSGRVLDVSLAD